MRKTKIVCTIGPASESLEVMKELMLAGMNVARINFSHGSYKEQENRINTVKKAREELNLPVALLLDTKGPEIRIGKILNNYAMLEKGEIFTLVNDDILGNNKRVSITYKNLYKEVTKGTKILINDGIIELSVEEVVDRDIVCKVINGGPITNRKSINVPDLNLQLPSLTEADIQDIKYSVEAGFDFIAASFVRKPEDVLEIKKVLKDNGGEHIKVISKIENREGINNFDKILEVSDGIMVARGDLGVEIPQEEVPILQKQFIRKCNKVGKPVITATQMLESMVENVKPTRAEVSDVANAIFDMTGAIMLSAESASGKHPVECVKTMDKIAVTTENSIDYWNIFKTREYKLENLEYKFNINHAIVSTARNMNAKAIYAYTDTGDTPRIISSFIPNCPIYAILNNEQTYRQLALSWNVYPKLYEKQKSIDKLMDLAIKTSIESKEISENDKIVIAGGAEVVENTEQNNYQINKVIGGIVQI